MILNFKHSLAVMIPLCLITSLVHAQSRDTLESATIPEKAQIVSLRMERELGLSKAQSMKVNQVLIERFQNLKRSGSSSSLSLETADRKALQRLATILSDDQYALYQELRTKKKQDKQKYMRDHPGFEFSKEDLEMDF